MKRIRLLFAAVALMILACNVLTQPFLPATPTPTASHIVVDPNCPNPQPTQKEIDFALQFKAEYFDSPDWKTSYTVMDYRVSKTWKSDELGAVANFDHIIFCGVTSAQLDDYYSPSNFELIFQNYDDYEHQRDCRSNDLRLYELKVINLGYDYNARFWVEIVDGDHTRETLLVFPIDDPTNMDSYSKDIMPELPSCD